jgi:hypothetical protein
MVLALSADAGEKKSMSMVLSDTEDIPTALPAALPGVTRASSEPIRDLPVALGTDNATNPVALPGETRDLPVALPGEMKERDNPVALPASLPTAFPGKDITTALLEPRPIKRPRR